MKTCRWIKHTTQRVWVDGESDCFGSYGFARVDVPCGNLALSDGLCADHLRARREIRDRKGKLSDEERSARDECDDLAAEAKRKAAR